MNREALDTLERRMMEEVVKRRKLGGYNSEAESVLLMSEVLLEVLRHLKERTPKSAHPK